MTDGKLCIGSVPLFVCVCVCVCVCVRVCACVHVCNIYTSELKINCKVFFILKNNV